jgi:hypothetical protein
MAEGCKITKTKDGKINGVLDQSGNKSRLFKEIFNVPTLNLDEAIKTYQNIYSEELKDSVTIETVPDIRFSKSSAQATKSADQEVIDRLKESGLAENVFQMSTAEINAKLEELGVDAETRKQVEAWHGSPYMFDKFSTSAMGTGEGAQAFGWGLYFTDLKSIAEGYANALSTEEVSNYTLNGKGLPKILSPYLYDSRTTKKDLLTDIEQAIKSSKSTLSNSKGFPQYDIIKNEINQLTEAKSLLINSKEEIIFKPNRNLYKVTLQEGKTPSEYNWLEWDKSITDLQIASIKVQNKKAGETIENWKNDKTLAPASTRSGEFNAKEVYRYLESFLESDKEASLFLLKAGIDGIKYPAESISRGATSDTARGFNYVVFDENAITIKDQIQFNKQLEKNGITLTTNGFVHNNNVYLNKDTADNSTAIHEFSHLFNSWLKTNSPETYKKGIELVSAEIKNPNSEIKSTIDFVKTTQPNLKGEALVEEILTQLVGERGAEMMGDQKAKSPLMQWLSDFWETIGKMLNIFEIAPSQIANLTLGEYATAMVVSLTQGNNIKGSQAQQYFTREADRLLTTTINLPNFLDILEDLKIMEKVC